MKNNLLPCFIFRHSLLPNSVFVCAFISLCSPHDAVNRFYTFKKNILKNTCNCFCYFYSFLVPIKYFWMVKKKSAFFVFFINVLYFSCYTSQGVFCALWSGCKRFKTKTFSLIVILISIVVKGW